MCVFIYFGGGEGKEKERERNICVWEIHVLVASHMSPNRQPGPTSQVCALTGNQTCDLALQDNAQPTEAHESGLIIYHFEKANKNTFLFIIKNFDSDQCWCLLTCTIWVPAVFNLRKPDFREFIVKKLFVVLAGVAQWIECQPTN